MRSQHKHMRLMNASPLRWWKSNCLSVIIGYYLFTLFSLFAHFIIVYVMMTSFFAHVSAPSNCILCRTMRIVNKQIKLPELQLVVGTSRRCHREIRALPVSARLHWTNGDTTANCRQSLDVCQKCLSPKTKMKYINKEVTRARKAASEFLLSHLRPASNRRHA